MYKKSKLIKKNLLVMKMGVINEAILIEVNFTNTSLIYKHFHLFVPQGYPLHSHVRKQGTPGMLGV